VDEQQWLEQSRWEGMKVLERLIQFVYAPSSASLMRKTMAEDSNATTPPAPEDDTEDALKQVTALLDEVDFIETLYPSLLTMQITNALYNSPDFVKAYDALKAWSSMTQSINQQVTMLKTWASMQDLAQPFSAAFLERLLKEVGLTRVFEGKAYEASQQLLRKSLQSMEEHRDIFIQMRLPLCTAHLSQVMTFMPRLMEDCLQLRLKDAKALHDTSNNANSNVVIHDQLLEDFRQNLTLAAKVRLEFTALAKQQSLRVCSMNAEKNYEIGHRFDSLLLETLKFYVTLLDWKFRSGRQFLWFKAAEFLEQEWVFLQNVSRNIYGGETLIAEQMWYVI
jgi:mitogen-activated protein kinase kinase kinase